MQRWLGEDYGLDPRAASHLMGQVVQYDVGNVFNPAYDGCPPAALEKLGVSYDVMTTRVSPQQR